jgi:hypothetical protein
MSNRQSSVPENIYHPKGSHPCNPCSNGASSANYVIKKENHQNHKPPY